MGLLIPLQYAYYHILGDFFPSIKPPSRMMHLFEKEVDGEYEIALIASSINFNIGKQDTDKRDIAQMLDDYLDDCGVLDVSRGGNNVELYDEITKIIIRHRDEPTRFVYEISLRTFARVYSEPTNARSLKDDEFIFKDNLLTSFYKALSVFRYDFNLDSQKVFDEMPVYRGTEYVTTLDKFMLNDHPSGLRKPQKKFLVNYMGRIEDDNAKLIALKNLADYINKHQLEVLFVIPPENYQQGIEHFPEDFEAELDENIDIIAKVLNDKKLSYLNLVKALGSERFTHTPLYPNGHLDQQGRQFVANQISQKIECYSAN